MHAANLGVGQRIRIAEDYGTILFIGEVAGTTGTWLGVEWDNGVKRGKHNGNKNGVQYFTCR
jgi:dynactin complex subunit